MKFIIGTLSVFLCFVGGLIYLAFRDESLIMFSWADYIGLNDIIKELRLQVATIVLPDWIIYSLPDGLWLLSYLLLISIVWENSNSSTYRLWLYILPVIAIGSEILQIFFPTLGTFDIWDLVCYLIALLIFEQLKKIMK